MDKEEPSIRYRSHRGGRRKIALVYGPVLLFFLVYYTWQLTRWDPPLQVLTDESRAGTYGELATAFRHGSVSLLIKPDKRLDWSSCPWDPRQRIDGTDFPWDYSYYRGSRDLYGGKFYLYFGPVPALVFYCPWKMATGHLPSQYLAFLMMSYLNVLLYAGLLRLLASNFFQRVPIHLEGLLLVMYGTCNLMLYLQCTPYMYQMAIASAVDFALACLICMLLAVKEHRHRYLWLVLASTSAGLAVHCLGAGIDVVQLRPI